MSRNNRATKVEAPVVEVEELPAPPAVVFDLEVLMTIHKTKSAVIRYLATEGQTRSQIAALMGIRYQHVRNVLTQPLKQKVEAPAEAE